LVDLGNWLDEKYRIPNEPDEEPGKEPSKH
jgi:endogenous inhibitor of DNA gyrase (YacG/DUF329 family)